MAYGIDPALFVEDGPANQSANAAVARSPERFGRWRKLDSHHRFEVVEKALRAPANDLIDDYPIAL